MLVNICKYIIHGPSGMDYGGPVWKRVLKPIQWCFGSWPKIPWRRWSEQRIYPHSHDLFEPKNYNHNFPTTWQIMILSVPDALWTAIDVWLFVCIYLFCFLFTNMFFFVQYSHWVYNQFCPELMVCRWAYYWVYHMLYNSQRRNLCSVILILCMWYSIYSIYLINHYIS